MEVYKLKHIPSGLFFQPSKMAGNLSKKGKAYVTKPNIDWALSIRIRCRRSSKLIPLFIEQFKVKPNQWGDVDQRVLTNKNDWEIVKL